jgi:nucleotide-binding universal stress UspA family protein
MTQRILVPLDGSVTSEAILPQVIRLARPKHSHVILLRAEHPIVTEPFVPIPDLALKAAREYLLGVGERLESQGIQAERIEEWGAPADRILQRARTERISLIAMATHGRSGLSRALLGSVAEQVVRTSPVPVFILRPFSSYEIAKTRGPEADPIRKILVPVDGSALQRLVVPHALGVARLFNSRVLLLHVLDPAFRERSRTTGEGGESLDARHALREVELTFATAGIESVTVLEEGAPAEKILGVAREQEVDLIAMATHGRRGISRLVSGSVTEKVLREATVPMLVVNGKEVARAEVSPSTGKLSIS